MAKRIPPYVKNKVAEVAKRVMRLKKNRIQRFRSPIFVLPEFADSPMLTVIVYATSQEELNQLAGVTLELTNEWIVVSADDLHADGFKMVKQNPMTENACMALNKAAVDSKGKIIAIFSSAQALLERAPDQWVKSIIESDEHVLVVSFQDRGSAIAVTRDMFLLGRGLDEMLADVPTAMQDFALRASLLGARPDKPFTPNALAKMNVDKGELMVNEGSDTFRKLFFAPR